MQFFAWSGGASLVRGLVRSVPCPWTVAERPLPSLGALRMGRCSELDATATAATTTAAGKGGGGGICLEGKNVVSPFFDASGNKNIGATICIRQRYLVSPVCKIFLYKIVR